MIEYKKTLDKISGGYTIIKLFYCQADSVKIKSVLNRLKNNNPRW